MLGDPQVVDLAWDVRVFTLPWIRPVLTCSARLSHFCPTENVSIHFQTWSYGAR